MREDNLLCVRRRRFVITTDSNHDRRIYPNLARVVALNADLGDRTNFDDANRKLAKAQRPDLVPRVSHF
jgi:hypothetical protein